MVRFSAPKELVVRGTDKVNERVNDRMNHLTDKEKQTIRLLSEDPGYTVSQLSEKMITSRKSIAGYLKKLKESGLIERIGSSKKGYWKISG